MKHIIKIGFVLFELMIHALVSTQAQGICRCEIPIDGSFQIAPMTVGQDTDIGVPPLYENDNATTPAMALPFSFCFYGQSFDSVYISNNGIVSFLQPIHTFIDSSQHFPLGGDTLIIAPFYADANTFYNSGLVYYKITQTHMIVIWDSIRYSGIDVDGWNYFQLIISNGTDPILEEGNNVSFCYPVIEWACSESSGGFSGYGGTPAFVGINKGDGINYAQISTFDLPGYLYEGPFSPYNGVDWIDLQSFTFNACASGNIIAPVILNDVADSNTLYICPCDTTPTAVALGAPDSFSTQPCDTVNLTAAFICAEPGQNCTLSYSYTGPLNIYSVYSSTANIIDSIVIQAIPVYSDTGTTVVKLTATDSVNHLQSTVTYNLVITVDCLNPPIPPSGIEALESKDGFAVYPNPADKYFAIKVDDVLSNTTAKIYNVLGSEVFSSKLTANKSSIDVSGLARGMYFVEVLKDGVPLPVKKIMVQ